MCKHIYTLFGILFIILPPPRDSDTAFKVKGQLVADVLNSHHTGIGATWRINTKMLSTCGGEGILWRPPEQLVSLSYKLLRIFLN